MGSGRDPRQSGVRAGDRRPPEGPNELLDKKPLRIVAQKGKEDYFTKISLKQGHDMVAKMDAEHKRLSDFVVGEVWLYRWSGRRSSLCNPGTTNYQTTKFQVLVHFVESLMPHEAQTVHLCFFTHCFQADRRSSMLGV